MLSVGAVSVCLRAASVPVLCLVSSLLLSVTGAVRLLTQPRCSPVLVVGFAHISSCSGLPFPSDAGFFRFTKF